MLFRFVGLVVLGFGLVLGCVKQAEEDPVVAEFGGKKIRASEAFADVKMRIYDLEQELYRVKKQAVEQKIERMLLEQEAKAQGVSVSALLDKVTALGGEAEVSDKEVEAFLKSRGISLKDPRIRKQDVKDYLKFKKRHEKRRAYVKELFKKAGVRFYLSRPKAPILKVNTEGFPSWGDEQAPVTIVEFSDFQCPFCARASYTVKKLKEIYGPKKIRVVYRDFPLPIHKRARKASLAALCANDQGKFWEFHDRLFANQSKMEDKDFIEHAKVLGLDVKEFEACYKSEKHRDTIKKNEDEARALGLEATPSFVINGRLLQGAQPLERFQEIIDDLLQQKS